MPLISRTFCRMRASNYRLSRRRRWRFYWLLANALEKDQWSISAKMASSLDTRKLLATLLLALCFCLGGSKDTDPDAKWMAPLKQYGYTAQHLKNKVEHGEFTTFELGTPNYQILNPEDEPEYITADQPHYQEMLKRLTSAQSGSHTIDMETAGSPVKVPDPPKQWKPLTQKSTQNSEVAKSRHLLGLKRWEKLKKRSSLLRKSYQNAGLESDAASELSLLPNIQVYPGARPFQSRVANLN
ncbi:uncharacterized protein LOC108097831 [Drosophila ficusphila]|uniref:uncharacterized protein LOC108097831 n=1 Tax=Drosophila ficusphila TaxID=30025 RepID=UPI001C8AAF41|nr:uncharacterized protein LOC108097831 [Drosophila ficusphila]